MLPDRRLHSIRFSPRHEHNSGGHNLSILLVGGPKGDRFGDSRVRQQGTVDFDRRDLLATAVDELFQAASERDVAILVEEALVSLLLVGGGGVFLLKKRK